MSPTRRTVICRTEARRWGDKWRPTAERLGREEIAGPHIAIAIAARLVTARLRLQRFFLPALRSPSGREPGPPGAGSLQEEGRRIFAQRPIHPSVRPSTPRRRIRKPRSRPNRTDPRLPGARRPGQPLQLSPGSPRPARPFSPKTGVERPGSSTARRVRAAVRGLPTTPQPSPAAAYLGAAPGVSPHTRKKRRQGGPAPPGRPSQRSCQSRPQPTRRARGRPQQLPTATLRAPLSAQPVPRTLPRTSRRARSGDRRAGGGASTWGAGRRESDAHAHQSGFSSVEGRGYALSWEEAGAGGAWPRLIGAEPLVGGAGSLESDAHAHQSDFAPGEWAGRYA